MDKIVFTIQKGLPIAEEDCRVDASELHIHICFDRVRGLASDICDYLNNFAGLNGGAVGWETDEKTDRCIVDIAMAEGETDERRAIDMVSNWMHIFILTRKINSKVNSIYPESC